MAVEVTIDVETKTWFSFGPLLVVSFGIKGGKTFGVIVVIFPLLISIDVSKRQGLTITLSVGGSDDECA